MIYFCIIYVLFTGKAPRKRFVKSMVFFQTGVGGVVFGNMSNMGGWGGQGGLANVLTFEFFLLNDTFPKLLNSHLGGIAWTNIMRGFGKKH